MPSFQSWSLTQSTKAKPVITAEQVGGENLDASVADVLELLIIGTIHIGFAGAEAESSESGVEQRREMTVRFDGRIELQRVAGGSVVDGVEDERFGGGLDVELQVPPAAIPEGFKDEVVAIIGAKSVDDANGETIVDVVAMAFAGNCVGDGLKSFLVG